MFEGRLVLLAMGSLGYLLVGNCVFIMGFRYPMFYNDSLFLEPIVNKWKVSIIIQLLSVGNLGFLLFIP